MKREMAGPMTLKTALQWQVHDDKKGISEYHGFKEVQSLSDLDNDIERGLIIVQDTYRVRFFVYDKKYEHAIDSFYRYKFGDNGIEPIYIMDYNLPKSQITFRKHGEVEVNHG